MPHPSPRPHSRSHPGRLMKKLAHRLVLAPAPGRLLTLAPPAARHAHAHTRAAQRCWASWKSPSPSTLILRRSPPALFPASPRKVWSADSAPKTCPTASIDKDGFRYLYGTYRVTNNGGALSNLSFYAMNTSGASWRHRGQGPAQRQGRDAHLHHLRAYHPAHAPHGGQQRYSGS